MKISVLMSVRNGEQYIAEALDSVLAQTLTDFELLIADDGSTYGVPQILKDYAEKDSRIKLFLYKESEGLAVRLNHLISQAKGEYLARMDGDDVCDPHRFAEQVAFLGEHKDVSVLGSTAFVLGTKKEIKVPENNDVIADYQYFSPAMIHPSVMMRRRDLLDNDIQYPLVPCAQDYGLWLLVQQKCLKIANLQKPLLYYRIHENSTTSQSRNTKKQGVLQQTQQKFFSGLLTNKQCKVNAAIAMGEVVSWKALFTVYLGTCLKVAVACQTWSGRKNAVLRFVKAVCRKLLAA